MPAESEKGFSVKAAVVVLYMIFLIAVPPWIVKNAFRQELTWFTNAFAVDTARWIAQTGEGWYDRSIVDSGLGEGVERTFLPTEAERLRSGAFKNLGSEIWFPYLRTRGEVLLQVLHQLFYRMAMLMAWSPFLILFVVPAVIDGMLRWRIRLHSFDYSSPFMHAMGFRGSLHGAGLLLAMLFLPLPAFHPYIAPVIITIYAFMLNMSAQHTQKRI
jgi:hypothetical protein